jgi:hypothetical protein
MPALFFVNMTSLKVFRTQDAGTTKDERPET